MNTTRRGFLRMAAAGMMAGILLLWQRLTQRQNRIAANAKTLKINTFKQGSGVFFLDDCIEIKTGKEIRVFSDRCTHAGCRISSENGEELLCSCHGSRFSVRDGFPTCGPALVPLKTLPFQYNPENGELTIKTGL